MIFFVAPLPPPIHGFSWVSKEMLSALNEQYTVEVFNTTPTNSNKLVALFNSIKLLLNFLFSVYNRKPNAIYLAISGGYRQAIDLGYIYICIAFKRKMMIHHHSFAYINNPSLLNRICMHALQNAVHIVLCENMGKKLSEIYNIRNEKFITISNAAFIRPPDNLTIRSHEILHIGFLSNITAAKGIWDFFDLLEKLKQKNILVKAFIAGPVSSEIQAEFTRRLSLYPTAKHVGPVYAARKNLFFSDLDLLFFPTRYENEAEPLTILEAMSYGLPVIAVNRGCISCMLAPESGTVIKLIEDFVDISTAEISMAISNKNYLIQRKKSARANFLETRDINLQTLTNTIKRIAL